jgi:hypothetical protein
LFSIVPLHPPAFAGFILIRRSQLFRGSGTRNQFYYLLSALTGVINHLLTGHARSRIAIEMVGSPAMKAALPISGYDKACKVPTLYFKPLPTSSQLCDNQHRQTNVKSFVPEACAGHCQAFIMPSPDVPYHYISIGGMLFFSTKYKVSSDQSQCIKPGIGKLGGKFYLAGPNYMEPFIQDTLVIISR